MKPFKFRGLKPDEYGARQTLNVLTGLFAFGGIYPCVVEQQQMANAAAEQPRQVHAKRSGRGGSRKGPIFRRMLERDRSQKREEEASDGDAIATFFDPDQQKVVECYAL